MHPELLSHLATERNRTLARGARAAAGSRLPRVRAAKRAHPLTRSARLPRIRLSWTCATLAAVPGGRRGSSLVIVISASRIA